MIAAQCIQLCGKTGEARMIVFQTILNEVNVFGYVAITSHFERQKGLDDVLCYRGSHQAGQISLESVAQTA